MQSSTRKATERFSDRVADYVKYRPSYPTEVVRILEREAHITPNQTRVVDLGAGTGISSELFLREGYAVTAVEPNRAMREVSARLLAGYPRFQTIEGTAEATTLARGAFDLAVAAQAFHWFDPEAARAELQRVLAPGGLVVLVWNDRRVEGAFLEGYEAALLQHGTDYAEVRHQNMEGEPIARFFGGPFTLRSVLNHQDFDLEGLIGRAKSSSYVPKEGPALESLVSELERLFAHHAEAGLVRFLYDTKVYFGPLTITA